jgi:hypothetical protein
MAKARRNTPAPTPTGKIIDAGKITMAGIGKESGLGVDARQFRWTDISDSGRPSPKDLYLKEAERRLKDGAVPPSHKEFANELLVWFKATHPKEKVPKHLTVERNIRKLRRRHHRQP